MAEGWEVWTSFLKTDDGMRAWSQVVEISSARYAAVVKFGAALIGARSGRAYGGGGGGGTFGGAGDEMAAATLEDCRPACRVVTVGSVLVR